MDMIGVLNGACTGLLVSVGHRTGLFDLLASRPPSTSDDIAKAAKLHPRYVREWLGGMTVAGIVSYDPAAGTYALPPEQAAVLTRAAGPDNLAMFAQYIKLMADVEDDIVRCFRRGGGVPYSKFKRFQELQAEESRGLYDRILVSAILPLAPGLVDRLNAGIDVADVGTGQGHAVHVMARAFPKSRFLGLDFSKAAVAVANRKRPRNARFAVQDVANLLGAFDLVTAFDTIHDQAKPAKVLASIAKSLRPGGMMLMMDIQASSRLEQNLQHPLGPLLYAASTFHCMTVSLAQKGDGLGTCWGEEKAYQMIRAAGFGSVDVHHLPGDVFHSFFVAVKSS